MSSASTTIRSTQPVPCETRLAPAQVAVGDRLLQQRAEQVEHVRPARDDALVDEELGWGRARHPASPRWADGDGTRPMVPHPTTRDDPGNRGPPAYHPAMLLALDIGNTNVTLGLFRAGALLATRRAATDPRATADELELLLDGLLRLDGIGAGRPRRDRAGLGRPGRDRRGRGDRGAARHQRS